MSGTSIITAAQYTPGSWVGMAASKMWLVADLDQRDPVVSACWALVAEAASVDQVLGALLEAQLRPALNLAIVRLDDAGAEIVVRGEAWAEVARESLLDSESFELRAGPGSFRDAKVDRFGVISLHLPPQAPGEDVAAAPVLALGAGVVPASQIAIHARHPQAQATVAPSEPSPPPSGGRFMDMFGKTVHPAEREQQTVAVPDEWMAGMRQQVEVARPEPAPQPQAPAGTPAAIANPFMDVSWAAVPEAPTAGPDPYDLYHTVHPAPTTYQPPPALLVPAPVGPSTVAPVATGGIDPELLLTVQRATSAPVRTGPTVGAVRCSSGHPNAPEASRCRICGGGIPPQTPQPMPRPILGVLRLSTGEVVPLDRGVILGRAPGAPETFGPDEPYRIQLPSPDGSISRKHVEVVLQGWSVSVVDLKSTNGTQVTAPGGMPEQLPEGGRRVIDNGWTVSLDATMFFRFEVTE